MIPILPESTLAGYVLSRDDEPKDVKGNYGANTAYLKSVFQD